VIALYARGASTRDIQAHLQDLYGVEISAHTHQESQTSSLKRCDSGSHDLDALSSHRGLDALLVKVKEGNQIGNKAVYLALGSTSRQQGTPRLWLSPEQRRASLARYPHRAEEPRSPRSSLLVSTASAVFPDILFTPDSGAVVHRASGEELLKYP